MIETKKLSFRETHNDHLQILAEAGVPGYALFLGSLVLLARLSFRRSEGTTARQRFARLFAFPAAAAFFMLAVGHPLQLTSTIVLVIYFSALCFAWTGDENP